jgi:hypothetical protein
MWIEIQNFLINLDEIKTISSLKLEGQYFITVGPIGEFEFDSEDELNKEWERIKKIVLSVGKRPLTIGGNGNIHGLGPNVPTPAGPITSSKPKCKNWSSCEAGSLLRCKTKPRNVSCPIFK